MQNYFLATKKDSQTIQQHTDQLLVRYYQLRALYPSISQINWELLRLACLYHDLGKMNVKYQNRVMQHLNDQGASYTLLEDELSRYQELPHEHLSVVFLDDQVLKEKFTEEEITLLYQVIYDHHDNKESSLIAIQKVANKELMQYYPLFDYPELELCKPNMSYQRRLSKTRRIGQLRYTYSQEMINRLIQLKGLLMRIDYAASIQIDIEQASCNLREQVQRYFVKKEWQYNHLQKYVLEHPKSNHVIVAATATGKTDAALLWIGHEKGLVALRSKVFINPLYDYIKNHVVRHDTLISQLGVQVILPVHLGGNDQIEESGHALTDQLAAPIMVCNTPSLIDFVLKDKGYEMKLATLSYMKVVIDELPIYSPQLLAYTLLALQQIYRLGGQFMILTTTLPAFFRELLYHYIPDPNLEPRYFFKLDDEEETFTRHRLQIHHQSINIEDIIADYGKKKILVVVNTIKKAQQLYEDLQENEYEHIALLHPYLSNKDKEARMEACISAGSSESSCLWITTPHIEVSTDIDFDVLYTELSELGGLFQRMGRVSRERRLESQEPNIHVYVGSRIVDISGVGEMYDQDLFVLARKQLISFSGYEVSEQTKLLLTERIYAQDKIRNTGYYKKFLKTLQVTLHELQDERVEREKCMLELQQKNIIPIEVYKQHKEAIDQSIEDMAEGMMQYVVSICAEEYIYARQKGHVIKCLEGKNDIAILNYRYDVEKGLYRPVGDEDKYCKESSFY